MEPSQALPDDAAVAVRSAPCSPPAEQRAALLADRLRRLHTVTVALSCARTSDQIADAMTTVALEAVEATSCGVCLLTADRANLDTFRVVGCPPSALSRWERFPLNTPAPVCDAVLTGQPVLLESMSARSQRYPLLRDLGQTPPQEAIAAFPLIAADETIGALLFAFPDIRTFDADEVLFLTVLTQQCALALERTRLVEVEQRARRNAQSEREWLRLAHRAGGIGAWEWDITTDEVVWTPEYREVYGHAAEIPPNFTDGINAVIEEDREAVRQAAMQSMREGTDFRTEHRALHPQKGLRRILGLGKFLRDGRGNPLRLVGIVFDITEQHESQEEIIKLNERLHRAVYESTHRIKNQLQILSATADMVLMDNPTVVSADELKRIRAQITAIAVTHDLLTKQTRIDGTNTDISLKAMLELTVTALQQTTDRHRLRHTLDDWSAPVKTATSLALACQEAVSNSFKHGADQVEITLRVEQKQGRLEISDDGPGFPEGFDPRRAANIGIDLLIALTSTDLRGIVEFTNRPEGGASVAIVFPLIAES